MRIHLEETKNAHVGWPTHGDEGQVVGRYNSLGTAVRSLTQHEAEMHYYCGKGAWSHNHRLIYRDGKEVGEEEIWEEMQRQEN